MLANITKSLPPSLKGDQWLRTLALPVAVAAAALAVAIAGALMMLLVYLLYEAIFLGRYRTALAYARTRLSARKPALDG